MGEINSSLRNQSSNVDGQDMMESLMQTEGAGENLKDKGDFILGADFYALAMYGFHTDSSTKNKKLAL